MKFCFENCTFGKYPLGNIPLVSCRLGKKAFEKVPIFNPIFGLFLSLNIYHLSV